MVKVSHSIFRVIGFFIIVARCDAALPIVIWHGMADTCCLPFNLGSFTAYIKQHIQGIYINSLMIGSELTEEFTNGFFLSPNKQVEMACEIIRNDSNLKNGFNAIGFSQGSQLLRGAIQRCGDLPRVNNFITLAGQHQGVFGIPLCTGGFFCEAMKYLSNNLIYHNWFQDTLVQATFWHDPLNENLYRAKSKFLADINNENGINENYKRNLMSLNKFIMVKYEGETVVQPTETSWFGYYAPGQAEVILNMTETNLYKEDRLGLKSLDESGRIKFLLAPGHHLHFVDHWFDENILPYLM